METSLHSPLSVTTLGASQRSLPPKFFVQYLDQWLIVDLRCSQLYSLGHIKGSRNLPLNKKKLLNVQLSELYLHKCLRKLSKFINERLKKKQVCYIVLYDHSSTETTVWNPIWKLHNRCQQQMFQGCSFFVLNGGFSLFSNLYPRHTVSCQVIECSRKTQALIPLLRCSVFQDSFPCKILSFVYLGNERNASDRDALDLLGITHILIVGEELVAHFPGIYEYKQLMIRDLETQDLHPFLDEAIAFIEKVKLSGRILVHCYAGVSRSAAVVLAYLIYLGNTFEEAWKFLIVQKSDVQPLGNFILQLKQYEERWKSLQDAV
ncbi:dual specificity phosphatase [Galdieria sulphuraria]|uniref:protein-tyrosine-phosphatase n=1 Tax=Galdieria sulphuraria TaxID=130081 RepID=M2XV17_GALSU|nr:dual specificity phosphatase [Galdieria sulphuraria]EME27488.1 dual specificity phosphatase [Galdieria sulphuraria]|eukprot:XP_005704008.1 dual specificity phosphatase [Galdieria sulphuraria]